MRSLYIHIEEAAKSEYWRKVKKSRQGEVDTGYVDNKRP